MNNFDTGSDYHVCHITRAGTAQEHTCLEQTDPGGYGNAPFLSRNRASILDIKRQ